MKQLYLEVAAAGGVTFRTGPSLRNHFLGIPYQKEHIVINRLSEQQLVHIIEKLEIPIKHSSSTEIETESLLIRLITNIQELNEPIDFTINNIYLNPLTDTYYDPFHGVVDIKNKIITAPNKLFLGNPIKMIEACRLAGELGFNLNVETWFNIYDTAQIIKHMGPDLIRHEIEQILSLPSPSPVFKHLQETRLLEYILPELAACKTVIQSKRSGVNNVFDHIMYALDACPTEMDLRLTILFHDIAKPQTLQCNANGDIHFFKHEIYGAKIAKTYLKYWNFSKETVHKVSHLILHHMFDADPRMTDKSVRRLIRKVGKEYIFDLLRIREADRSGTPQKISMRKIKLLKKKIERALSNGIPDITFVRSTDSSSVSSPSSSEQNPTTRRPEYKNSGAEKILGSANGTNSRTNGTVPSELSI